MAHDREIAADPSTSGLELDPALGPWCYTGMKKLPTIVLCAAVAVLCGCTKPVVIDWDQLDEQDHLKYFEGKPFTGIAVKKFESGQKNWERTFKEGKRHGLATGWYENGQKDDEATYKAGKLHGRYTEWYENGEKSEEGTYKDDQLISSKKFHEVDEETQKAAP